MAELRFSGGLDAGVKPHLFPRQFGRGRRRFEERHDALEHVDDGRLVGVEAAVSSFSSDASLRASSWVSVSATRILMNARTTNMLICTACGLLRMLAAMMAPCSVKAKGRERGSR